MWEQSISDLVDPFGVQMQLHLLFPVLDKVNDFRERPAPETHCEQRLDEEDSGEPMGSKQIQGVRQSEITACRRPIDILPERACELSIDVDPSFAPDLYIHGKEDVKHGCGDNAQVTEHTRELVSNTARRGTLPATVAESEGQPN